MQIPRIYCDSVLTVNTELTLSTDASRHVLTVLRLKLSNLLILFNGQGGEYLAKLIHVKKNQALVEILEYRIGIPETSVKLHLGQVIAKGDRMDYAIQKAVELGVSSITPLYANRCDVKLDEKRLKNRLSHWQKIILHACEQSGRCDVPILNSPEDFHCCYFLKASDLKFICAPGTDSISLSSFGSPKEIIVCIGSEGGWEENEIELAVKNNFHLLKLGPRILRTETATVVALTLMQRFFGDFMN